MTDTNPSPPVRKKRRWLKILAGTLVVPIALIAAVPWGLATPPGQRWLLLKGGGYVAAGLPPGTGRRVADIDVLVPRADLARVEQLLRDHGWEFPDLDPYDERYYREWMHELPPLIQRNKSITPRPTPSSTMHQTSSWVNPLKRAVSSSSPW